MTNYKVIIKGTTSDHYYNFAAESYNIREGAVLFYVESRVVRAYSLHNLIQILTGI